MTKVMLPVIVILLIPALMGGGEMLLDPSEASNLKKVASGVTNQYENASRRWLKSSGLLPKTKNQLKIFIESKLSIEPGKAVHLMITISNMTNREIKAPDAYWAARVILDGKEFPYARSFYAWNGAGVIIPKGSLFTGMGLSDWGVMPGPGKHKIKVKIGEDVSNELELTFPKGPPGPMTQNLECLLPDLSPALPNSMWQVQLSYGLRLQRHG